MAIEIFGDSVLRVRSDSKFELKADVNGDLGKAGWVLVFELAGVMGARWTFTQYANGDCRAEIDLRERLSASGVYAYNLYMEHNEGYKVEILKNEPVVYESINLNSERLRQFDKSWWYTKSADEVLGDKLCELFAGRGEEVVLAVNKSKLDKIAYGGFLLGFANGIMGSVLETAGTGENFIFTHAFCSESEYSQYSELYYIRDTFYVGGEKWYSLALFNNNGEIGEKNSEELILYNFKTTDIKGMTKLRELNIEIENLESYKYVYVYPFMWTGDNIEKIEEEEELYKYIDKFFIGRV